MEKGEEVVSFRHRGNGERQFLFRDRDGIEDFEYLWTLKQEVSRLEKLRGAADGTTRAAIDAALKQAGTALGAPDRLAQSPAVYTQDVLTLMAERQRVAEAIEACRAVGR